MFEKIDGLLDELLAGNTAVLDQIIALLGKMCQKRQISYRDYKACCNKLERCPDY